MGIATISCDKSDVLSEIESLLVSEFDIGIAEAHSLASDEVWPHLDQLVDSVFILIETPYVDKFYRDSYYKYFSSKSGSYKKDCIRLSLFSERIDVSGFRKGDKVEEVRSKYLGFIVLRPTIPFLLGRSAISPKALKANNFLCCSVGIPATANMLKMKVSGFPHSSQDTETITCAETTIWAIMEYFGYKYAEYKPSSPSRIIDALRNVSAERQVPSKGLNIQQMAFALKEFGFGPRIYSESQFGSSFHSLIRTYVESGIPMIVAIENLSIGHAILCIGREEYSSGGLDGLPLATEADPAILDVINRKNIGFYDLADLDSQYVFIDDNHPVYQKAHLSNPAKNYSSPSWGGCEITSFIAPLYPKIYLEAFEAKQYFKQFFFRNFEKHIPDGTEVVVRFFLASSRSFKHSVALNVTMEEDMRDLILETSMPKFVWVGELSNKAKLKNKKAVGLVILDATEPNLSSNKPLILAGFNDKIITFATSGKGLTVFSMPFSDFEIFSNNLKKH